MDLTCFLPNGVLITSNVVIAPRLGHFWEAVEIVRECASFATAKCIVALRKAACVTPLLHRIDPMFAEQPNQLRDRHESSPAKRPTSAALTADHVVGLAGCDPLGCNEDQQPDEP